MNKELIDLAWSVLPKEFKEEVKKEWSRAYYNDTKVILGHFFGKHNLTSDAEGEEELLTVPRSKVQELYRKFKKDGSNACLYAAATIDALFGSKCLLDEKKTDVKDYPPYLDCPRGGKAEPKFKVGDKVVIIANCKHKGEVTEIIHVDDDMAASYKLDIYDDGKWYTDADLEPYTEPKYHKGEKVYYNGYAYEVEGLVGKNRYALKGLNFDLDEDMIEPYTEPNPIGKEVNFPTKNEFRNLSQNIAICDKQFDNILKDSFREHNRLHIAAMVIASIMGSSDWSDYRGATDEDVWRNMAKASLGVADALIAECEKGGSDV